MRIRRKANNCLNCESTLDTVYNYCPNCGQENNNNSVSFGTLVFDFFSNYFALDSKFSKSIKPFFIYPGYLTNKFIVGQRASFVNPVRLYLIISLFYFLIFSVVGTRGEDDSFITTTKNLRNISGINDSTLVIIRETLDEDDLENILDNMDSMTVDELRKALTNEDKENLKEVLDDNTLMLLNIGVAFAPNEIRDSLKSLIPNPNKIDLTDINPDSVITNTPDNDQSIFNKIDWEQLIELSKNRELTVQQTFDSLNLGKVSWWEDKFVKQTIIANREGKKRFVAYIIKNLPIMMFVLLPIFALILKLLYYRRNILYIKHLVHALYLHAFAYFFYGITLLIIISVSESANGWIGFLGFVMVSTYAYISFLNVYKQHWFKTLIKFNLLGFTYAICLMMFLSVEIFISFMLFD